MNKPHKDKQGRVCCLFLMDMRRAVMVVNALSIIFNGVALVLIHAQAIPWYDGGTSIKKPRMICKKIKKTKPTLWMTCCKN